MTEEEKEKIRQYWAPKGPPSKPWSQQTIEERVDTSIKVWEDNLARIDHDGTALTHDTYNKDPLRYHTATDYQTFVQVLHSIRERNI